MKSKLGVLITMVLMTATAAYSQVESDDMYFNSSDRAKFAANKPVSMATIPQADDARPETPTLNATDNYSGRGENPDYNSSISSGEASYFVPNYQPTGINQNLSNTYSGYGSPYSSPYGCNCASGYGSPYYNSMYSLYGMSPYSGMGMGYGMGMGMSYGMGMGYGGYGSMYGYNSMLSLGYGYGSPYMSYGMSYGMGYGYGYGGVVVVDGNSGYSYGKRAARTNGLNNTVYTRPSGSNSANVTRTNSSGRVASNESQYYQRGWRSNPNTNTSRNTTNTSNSRNWYNSGQNSTSSGSRNWSGGDNGGSRSSFGSGSSGSGGRSFSGGSSSFGGGSSGGGGGGGGARGGRH